MRRLLLLAVAAALLAGCHTASMQFTKHKNPYENPPFYSRYLNPRNPLDQQIQATVDALRTNPKNAAWHNNLGQLLAQKGFPKDAETEFERAINYDRKFYQAWYNLGLLRSARGDYVGARIAFSRAVHYKPGHAEALFQLGLAEERRGNTSDAIADYAKAFSINHALLDVKVNPNILDSDLIPEALIKAYAMEHSREALLFQGTPPGYGQQAISASPAAPSQIPAADKIVPPAAPVTDPARQTPAPNNPPH